MAVRLGKGWLWGLSLAALAVSTLLVLAWRNAGVEPIRPLTAPAVLPEVAR